MMGHAADSYHRIVDHQTFCPYNDARLAVAEARHPANG